MVTRKAEVHMLDPGHFTLDTKAEIAELVSKFMQGQK